MALGTFSYLCLSFDYHIYDIRTSDQVLGDPFSIFVCLLNGVFVCQCLQAGNLIIGWPRLVGAASMMVWGGGGGGAAIIDTQ